MELLHREDLSKNGMFVIEVKTCFEDLIQYDNENLLDIKYIFFDEKQDAEEWFISDGELLKSCRYCLTNKSSNFIKKSIPFLSYKNNKCEPRDVFVLATMFFLEAGKGFGFQKFIKKVIENKNIICRIFKDDTFVFVTTTGRTIQKFISKNSVERVLDENGYELEVLLKDYDERYIDYSIKKKPKGREVVDNI